MIENYALPSQGSLEWQALLLSKAPLERCVQPDLQTPSFQGVQLSVLLWLSLLWPVVLWPLPFELAAVTVAADDARAVDSTHSPPWHHWNSCQVLLLLLYKYCKYSMFALNLGNYGTIIQYMWLWINVFSSFFSSFNINALVLLPKKEGVSLVCM